MVNDSIEPEFDEDGKLIDFLTNDLLEDRPEERVRQKYLRVLFFDYHYPKEVLAREVPIYYGRNEIVGLDGNPKRADIVVYEDSTSRSERDQGRIRIVIETKAPDEESGHNQLMSYIFVTSAKGAVWYNGTEIKYYKRESIPENNLIPWVGIPEPDESWDSLGRRRKSQLEDPTDIKGLFKRCHDKLHRRGTSGDDITLDMVRILIAKCRDEQKPGDMPDFFCTAEEYSSNEGRVRVTTRIERLFEEFRDANPLVFDQHESILVGPDQIVEVVSELQKFRLVSNDEHQWDIMGAVYEEYTADELKKEGGEFFTNRLIVNFLVKVLNPSSDDLILDPAGGTGGFCTATLRYLREKIRSSDTSDGVKRRLIEQIPNHIFYIDIKNRLVKIAKSAMLLTGDGHQGCIQGDSLGPIANLEPSFLTRCRPGTVTKLLTNPPFAGLANGRITDPRVLSQFELGKKWEWRDGRYLPTQEISRIGTPPETLFLERCLEWLSPGGMIGIVQPKGVLDTTEPHLATRHLIFRKCRVLGVVNCHKNTFQPYTGTRTTLLILEKKSNESEISTDDDYPIFMAISKKIGQDSLGTPIYKSDDEGKPTSELDHDLNEIFTAWESFKNNALIPSEYVFSINKSEVEQDTLNINPQKYLPSLNESLRQTLQIGEREGWSVTTIGQITSKVYKGERFKRDDLECESEEGSSIVKYFTPGALLQGRGESVKYLDLSKAPERRKKSIMKHLLKRGQILITRSGSIGRVLYVVREHEGHVGSDDLIRIEIPDQNLRFYVYGFLKTKLGQDQMKRNEYGTIQQHLEPRHIKDIIIPIPDDRTKIDEIGGALQKSVEAKERSYELETTALDSLNEICE